MQLPAWAIAAVVGFCRTPLQTARFYQEVAPEAFISVKEAGSYRKHLWHYDVEGGRGRLQQKQV